MLRNDGSRAVLVVAVLAVVLLPLQGAHAGAFKSEPYPSWKKEGISQKWNLFTFYEVHERLSVYVSVEISRFHDPLTFFPLQIAVANANSIPVRITPEEFVLTDDRGVYYPLAEHTAIQAEYNKSSFDRTLLVRAEFLSQQFFAFTQIASSFYPNLTGGVKNDRIQLPQQTYLSDVLYFRKPEGTLEGHNFTLTVYFPQQERQLDVKFEIPVGRKKGD